MITRSRQTALVIACTISLLAGTASSSQAGIIPWLYDSIFGPNMGSAYGAGYSPYYGPSMAGASMPQTVSAGYYSNYAYMPYSSSACSTGCSTGCSPCGGASACGPSGCATGSCGVNYQSSADQGEPTPVEDGNVPQTYAPDPTVPVPPVDEGFHPRTQEGSGDTGGPEVPAGDGTDIGIEGGAVEAYKVPATVIPQKQPADAAPPVGDEADKANNDADKAKSESDDPQTGRLRLPRIPLDESVAWRVVPKRERLSIRANFTSPTVARSKVPSNANWVIVPTATQLVRK